MTTSQHVTVDRVEGAWVIVEDAEGREVHLPRHWFSAQPSEGAVFRVEVSRGATEARLERSQTGDVAALQAELMAEDDGEDFDL